MNLGDSNCRDAIPPDPQEWDAFVAGHVNASLYHLWRWSEIAGRCFGFPLHRIFERNADGRLTGVLPLVEQRSAIFGRRLVSLPFFNYGGPLGTTEATEHSLLQKAVQCGHATGVRMLELRDIAQRPGFTVRSDKVTLELALPQSAEALGEQLGSKLRSQIRRADHDSPDVAFGGADLVGEFYPVFAATMRDLDTHVYPLRFFTELLSQLAADCTVVVVRLRGKPRQLNWTYPLARANARRPIMAGWSHRRGPSGRACHCPWPTGWVP